PWRAGKDLSTVVENMEIGTGQRGDGRHAFVTREELVGLKLARRRASLTGMYSLNPGVDAVSSEQNVVEHPAKPQNVKATGGFGSVLLEWDVGNYRGHSLTEIWRGTEDDLADAVLVATTPGQVYGDPVDPGWSGFYWIRFVNAAGVKGPWHAVSGVAAQTQISVQALIDQIKEEAANSPVVEELRQEIKDAEGRAVEEAGIQTTEAVGNLKEETLKTIGGVESRITGMDSSTSESLNEINERITELDEGGSKAFLSMWSKKAGADGVTAGIGIVAGTDSEGRPVSQVAISASQLFVFDPNDPDNTAYPFAVSGGKVVITKALISDAVIETLAAQNIVADEVKAGVSITSPVIRSAVIQNGNFQVGSDGSIKSGEHFSVSVNGDVTASNAKISGHIDADSGTLNNVMIEENCIIKGTMSADRIIGDIVKGYSFEPNDGTLHITNNKYGEGYVIFKAEVSLADDVSFDRKLILLPFTFYSGTLTIEINGRVVIKAEPRVANTGTAGYFDRYDNPVYTYTNLGDTVSGVWDVTAGEGDTRITVTMRVEGGPGNMGDVEGRKQELVKWKYNAFTLMVAKSSDSGFTRIS
uniref:phage tail tip fiber protein n=1 Tax=Escherichia coli TaxID=562 RepID=UPI000D0A9600